jgi:hypothetical protein
MSNCRAASRVRQYPAVYTVSTAAQLAATKLFEIRPLPLRLGMSFIVRGAKILPVVLPRRRETNGRGWRRNW